MKTMLSRLSGKGIRVTIATAGLLAILADSALAQAPASGATGPPDPNPGAVTFAGNLDVLPKTPYIFRGIVQEADPQLTQFASGDLGLALLSDGAGGVKSVSVNFGVWNSLQTGSSGLGGSSNKLHYEEDFYATLGLGLANSLAFATTYTAYTSPNGLFGTTHEILFKLSQTSTVAPFGLIAFELSGGADAGPNTGTYMELGVGPNWPLAGGKATVAVPMKVGVSLNDYYEHPETGVDNRFGFFDAGVVVTVPLSGIPSSYGSWNVHVGGDLLALGETTKYFNAGKRTKGVFLFGFGLTY